MPNGSRTHIEAKDLLLSLEKRGAVRFVCPDGDLGSGKQPSPSIAGSSRVDDHAEPSHFVIEGVCIACQNLRTQSIDRILKMRIELENWMGTYRG